MKFARTDLIARVEAEIARREQRAAERYKAATARYQENRAKYLASTAEAWKTLADTIRRRLRTSTPMTADDIPQSLRGDYRRIVSTWDERHPDQVTPDTSGLAFLLELLRACTDEEITTASLERMGLRWTNLFRGNQ